MESEVLGIAFEERLLHLALVIGDYHVDLLRTRHGLRLHSGCFHVRPCYN